LDCKSIKATILIASTDLFYNFAFQIAQVAELVDLSADRQARFLKYCYNMFYIYAIASLNRNWIYVGMTIDLKGRIERHNGGRERTPKGYKPFELIYTEAAETRLKARTREKYWKSGVGKEQLRLIRDNKIVPK
jgi:putative endonuclease